MVFAQTTVLQQPKATAKRAFLPNSSACSGLFGFEIRTSAETSTHLKDTPVCFLCRLFVKCPNSGNYLSVLCRFCVGSCVGSLSVLCRFLCRFFVGSLSVLCRFFVGSVSVLCRLSVLCRFFVGSLSVLCRFFVGSCGPVCL